MSGVEFETKFTLGRDGWNARTLHLHSHAGTHMDFRFDDGGRAVLDADRLDECDSAIPR